MVNGNKESLAMGKAFFVYSPRHRQTQYLAFRKQPLSLIKWFGVSRSFIIILMHN